MSLEDKSKILRHFYSGGIFVSIKEIIDECFFHKRIFKKTFLLGYMHMSIAFGWLMLILIGHLEVIIYSPEHIGSPYYPIFFRFFNLKANTKWHEFLFSNIMDFFLLITLSGILLAVLKRFYKRIFGIRRTTQLSKKDSIVLYILWTIFPLRFLAESNVAHSGNGGFLTAGFFHYFGNFDMYFFSTNAIWWIYSIMLGLFFIMLPHSRYMHIPTEVLLIVLRNSGIRIGDRADDEGYNIVNIYSCSSCGLCIDTCQMNSIPDLGEHTSAYFIRKLRYNKESSNHGALSCLMCGRCASVCPVKIDICSLRHKRRKGIGKLYSSPQQYKYINIPEFHEASKEYDVIYFAGCMTHLTPNIKKAMIQIFECAKVNYLLMDKNDSICCGRPMMLAGHVESAKKLININKKIIEDSKAKMLITSCPICYRAFKELYNLNIEVLHHTEYLSRIIEDKLIEVKKSNNLVVYHNPCALSRYSNISKEPYLILDKISNLVSTNFNDEFGLCCGGSIDALNIDYLKRKVITKETILALTENHSNIIVTSCPLCKKTFSAVKKGQVKDIAELVVEAIED